MPISRRSFSCSLLNATALIGSANAQVFLDTAPPLPSPDLFEAGDFVWPKRPGAFVPYSQKTGLGPPDDREIWEREKRDFLAHAERGETTLSAAGIANLRSLDYREFLARYHGDQKPNEPGVYSSGHGVYIGHVGIIDLQAPGRPMVIEALWGKGVVRRSYDEWIAERSKQVVWLGRLREHSKSQRASIATEAAKNLGKPYNFWNFDLNDETSFYCSKLVWLSIYRSLGFPVDGNPNGKRDFWLPPKKLLYLPTIDRIHDPGPYAYR